MSARFKSSAKVQEWDKNVSFQPKPGFLNLCESKGHLAFAAKTGGGGIHEWSYAREGVIHLTLQFKSGSLLYFEFFFTHLKKMFMMFT